LIPGTSALTRRIQRKDVPDCRTRDLPPTSVQPGMRVSTVFAVHTG
jgi:hypothetical protein